MKLFSPGKIYCQINDYPLNKELGRLGNYLYLIPDLLDGERGQLELRQRFLYVMLRRAWKIFWWGRGFWLRNIR
jgi:hypothetical protein